MGTSVRLILDGAAVAAELRGTGGPVYLDFVRRADILIAAAQTQLLSQRKSFSSGSLRLEASIVKRFALGPTGLLCTVVAGAGLSPSYAYWVHEGNGPPGDRIFPKTKKFLVFDSSGGKQIFAKSVRTSAPNRYLFDNLPLVTAA